MAKANTSPTASPLVQPFDRQRFGRDLVMQMPGNARPGPRAVEQHAEPAFGLHVQIEHRLEVLDGYLIAFLNIDEVIRIVRFEDEPPGLAAGASRLARILHQN